MNVFITTIVVMGLIFLFIGSLYLNAQTEVPESCKEAYEQASGCGTCSSENGSGHSCGYKETLKFLKEVKLK